MAVYSPREDSRILLIYQNTDVCYRSSNTATNDATTPANNLVVFTEWPALTQVALLLYAWPSNSYTEQRNDVA